MPTVAIPNVRSLIALPALIWIGAGDAQADNWTADRFHLFYSNDSNAAPRLDRWRTVALAGEWVFNRRPGRQVAVQVGAEIIAPERLNPAGIPTDRAFAGIVQAQVREYRTYGRWETRWDAGLSFVGPQTGLSDFLDAAHGVLGGVPVSAFVANTQVPNDVVPEIGGEVAARITVNTVVFRPFAEVQAGLETYARVGVDFGVLSDPGVQRMPVTGALMGQPVTGWSFGGGLDVTHVTASHLVPAGRSVSLEPNRLRLRAAASYGLNGRSVDFGLAWMGPEFTEQRSGQFIGTVGLTFDF